MRPSRVCIQFTGGKDSTLLAARVAREFDEVHLLTFRNELVEDWEKVGVNVAKLRGLFGPDRFRHVALDNGELLRRIYTGSWVRDVARYGTYAANNICGPCRLSMMAHTIAYCRERGIAHVRDGANRTGFDLSQQVWSLELTRRFYAEFGIGYESPVYASPRNDIDLLKLGLSAEDPVLLFRSQARCKGGGEIHNIYLRCYFLPRYGREGRRARDVEWMQDKLAVCREFIAARENAAAARRADDPGAEISRVPRSATG